MIFYDECFIYKQFLIINMERLKKNIRGLSQKFVEFCHYFAENELNKKQITYPVSATFHTHVCKILQQTIKLY